MCVCVTAYHCNAVTHRKVTKDQQYLSCSHRSFPIVIYQTPVKASLSLTFPGSALSPLQRSGPFEASHPEGHK